MLLDSVTLFDPGTTCWKWQPDEKDVYMYLRASQIYVNDILSHRRQIYLSEIYKALGVVWDMRRADICITYDEINYLEFDTFANLDGTFLIHIMCYHI